MRHLELLGLWLLSAALLAGPIGATERVILGKRLLVRDPTGAEEKRLVVVLARETSTDVPSLVGDPTVAGATLRIVTNGSTPSDESYDLNADNWSAISSGFIFRAGGILTPVGVTAPIRRAVLRRTPGGLALMKLVLRGNAGIDDLDIVPPNPGTDGVVVLSINNGGDHYCASYGGEAGGTVDPNTDRVFKVRNPTTQPPCPANPSPVCCDFGTQQICAWADDAEDCLATGGNPGDPTSVCDSVTGLCTLPPAEEGYCCEQGTMECSAGPGVALVTEGGTLCTAVGGTLFSSAVCTPAGDCASPSGAFVDPAPEPF